MRFLLTLLLMCHAGSALAATYQYTGGLLSQTYFRGPTPIDYELIGPIDLDRLRIELNADLAPNSSYLFSIGPDGNGPQARIVENPWAATLVRPSGDLEVVTNNHGDIVDWYLSMFTGGSDYAEIASDPSGGDYLYYGYEYGYFDDGPPTDDNFRTSREWIEARARAGRWETVTPVPLPASGLILLTGLGAFAGLRRFRKVS